MKGLYIICYAELTTNTFMGIVNVPRLITYSNMAVFQMSICLGNLD